MNVVVNIVYKACFEGILPHLERRYRETESNYVRDDLAQYLSNAACDAL